MRQIIENPGKITTLPITSIEAAFLYWADQAVTTTVVECVWTGATFLAHRAPSYRTTSNVVQLATSFLKMRNGGQLPANAEHKLRALQEVLTSLDNLPKRDCRERQQ